MPFIATVNSIWRNFFTRERVERDLDQEIRSHIDLLAAEKIGQGMSPVDAVRAARLEFGGVERVKQQVRQARVGALLETIWQDVRFGIRMLRKSPGFTVLAVLMFALGIGANTAVFSVVDAVLLRPLHAPEPDRLVQFLNTDQGVASAFTGPQMFNEWRQHTSSFENVSAYRSELANLSGLAQPEQIPIARVSADFFTLFDAPVFAGSTFNAVQDRPGAGNFAVLSYSFWLQQFGRDPQVLNKTIQLGGNTYSIIGILGSSFDSEQFDSPPQIWVPFQIDPNAVADRSGFCYVAGRLKSGVSRSAANSELQSLAQEYHQSHPGLGSNNSSFAVESLRDAMVGDVQSSLLLLSCAVTFVLLIACSNVANLLLLRTSARKHEVATRLALGCGRWRVVRQFLTETLLLAFLGGVLGLLVGWVGTRLLLFNYHGGSVLTVAPVRIPRIGDAGSAIVLDWRILLFTALLSLVGAVVSGVGPVLHGSRVDVSTLFRDEARVGTGQTRVRSFLVVAEVSLALVLLVSSALLIRTLTSLRSVDPGFESRNLLTMQMSLAGTRFYRTSELDRLVRNGAERISSLPGVVSASSACCIPMDTVWQLPFIISGRELSGKFHGFAGWTFVSPGYFNTFGVPLLRGRAFTESDDENASAVVIINSTMAKRFWPNQDPLGQGLLIGRGMRPDYDKDPIRRIVGIVGDVRDVSLNRPPRPAMYVPMTQLPDETNTINFQQLPIAWFVRTKGEPYGVGAQVEKELLEVSGGVPTTHFRSMTQVESQSTTQAQFSTSLMTAFGCVALILAAIGIYGIAAYSVEQRTHEIGIRMALGAKRGAILHLVIVDALKLVLIGALFGLVGASMLTRLLSNFLFGVGPHDPFVFASVTAFVIAVALTASYLAARRATHLDPMFALRHE